MYGENVYKLSINISNEQNMEKIIFQKEGNYGQNWNYGQVTINETGEFKVGKILCFKIIYLYSKSGDTSIVYGNVMKENYLFSEYSQFSTFITYLLFLTFECLYFYSLTY